MLGTRVQCQYCQKSFLVAADCVPEGTNSPPTTEAPASASAPQPVAEAPKVHRAPTMSRTRSEAYDLKEEASDKPKAGLKPASATASNETPKPVPGHDVTALAKAHVRKRGTPTKAAERTTFDMKAETDARAAERSARSGRQPKGPATVAVETGKQTSAGKARRSGLLGWLWPWRAKRG